ncbi:hypothetical protein MY11210_005160 [Beauveria gryllotalpidicola]
MPIELVYREQCRTAGILVVGDSDDDMFDDDRETQQLPCITCLDKA